MCAPTCKGRFSRVSPGLRLGTVSHYFATACGRAGPRGSWTRKRERERERPSLFILTNNVFTKIFTTRLSACLAERLTDATHAHAHTHTHTDRDSAGEVEPLQGTRRPLTEAARACGKTTKGLSQRRERQPLPNKAVVAAAFPLLPPRR